jgi:glucose/arabinose dehydrogenase
MMTTHKRKMIIILSTIVIVGGIGIASFLHLETLRSQQVSNNNSRPTLKYPYNNSLKVELVAEGLSSPTSMEFIDDKNLLVLEKEEGIVQRVSIFSTNTSTAREEPALKLSVNSMGEQGLLGIASTKDDNIEDANSSPPPTSVFLYYTHSNPPKNSIYKYQWDGQRLIDPELILDLPSQPGPYHQGGKLLISIGKDKLASLYAVIGDLTSPDSLLQNNRHRKIVNNTSVILKINLAGVNGNYSSSVIDSSDSFLNGNYDNHIYRKGDTVTSSNNNLNGGRNSSDNYHYSFLGYGIRNSFGLAVDPVTGVLWDTENGEDEYDEINLVRPGFNSGWMQVMGPMSRNFNKTQENLVSLYGSKYTDPIFSWKSPIGITDIEFLNTTKLGAEFANNILVGDINNGNLYYLKVNESRTGIDAPNGLGLDNRGLADHVADNNRESSSITFGTNFGRITDIDTGPDGLVYVLSYEEGKIFRISPIN